MRSGVMVERGVVYRCVWGVYVTGILGYDG